jgi:hypothetical protein
MLNVLVTGALATAAIVLGMRQRTTDDKVRSLSPVGVPRSFLSVSPIAPKGFNSSFLDTSPGSWQLKATFPGPAAAGLSDGSAVAVGQRVYYIGGHLGSNASGNVVSTGTYIYDPVVDGFTTGPPLPRAISRGGAAYDGVSTIYYAGGVSREGGKASALFGNTSTPCLFSLGVAADGVKPATQWKALPCMATPRSDFCTAWTKGKLYVIGGVNVEFVPLDSIEIFDPAAGTWSKAPFKLPAGRVDHACAVLHDRIYVAGGIDTIENAASWEVVPISSWFTGGMLRIDVTTGAVEPRAEVPEKRGDMALSMFSENTLLAAGGETFDLDAKRTLIGTHGVWLYTESLDVWVRAMRMPRGPVNAPASHVLLVDCCLCLRDLSCSTSYTEVACRSTCLHSTMPLEIQM